LLRSPGIFGVGLLVPVDAVAVPGVSCAWTPEEEGDDAVEGIELSALLAVSGEPP
jgi:hypothetical protein